MAGEAPALSHAFHANLFKLAQSGGALVWTYHPTGHPPWIIQECAPVYYQHRTICEAVQPAQARVCLDSNCGLDPSKSRSSMQSYFWDATLAQACAIPIVAVFLFAFSKFLVFQRSVPTGAIGGRLGDSWQIVRRDATARAGLMTSRNGMHQLIVGPSFMATVDFKILQHCDSRRHMSPTCSWRDRGLRCVRYGDFSSVSLSDVQMTALITK